MSGRYRRNCRCPRSTESSVFATRFSKFSASWNRTLCKSSAAVSNSFGDLTPPIESHNPPKNLQNIHSLPNEFTDFEQFDNDHPYPRKTIFATSTVNHPGDGITLRTTALRVTYGGLGRTARGPRRGRKNVPSPSFPGVIVEICVFSPPPKVRFLRHDFEMLASWNRTLA